MICLVRNDSMTGEYKYLHYSMYHGMPSCQFDKARRCDESAHTLLKWSALVDCHLELQLQKNRHKCGIAWKPPSELFIFLITSLEKLFSSPCMLNITLLKGDIMISVAGKIDELNKLKLYSCKKIEIYIKIKKLKIHVLVYQPRRHRLAPLYYINNNSSIIYCWDKLKIKACVNNVCHAHLLFVHLLRVMRDGWHVTRAHGPRPYDDACMVRRGWHCTWRPWPPLTADHWPLTTDHSPPTTYHRGLTGARRRLENVGALGFLRYGDQNILFVLIYTEV